MRFALRLRYTLATVNLLEVALLPTMLLRALVTISLPLLLQACASEPVEQPVPAEEDVELTLNLPEEGDCACVSEDSVDYTFLEKGFATLADGEHAEAMQYFKQYQRLETSPEADWEARIAMAFVNMLPRNPLYDPQAAHESFNELREMDWKGMELHQQTLIMRYALAAFAKSSRQMAELNKANETLEEDLEKREEALKRLRELTLGQ